MQRTLAHSPAAPLKTPREDFRLQQQAQLKESYQALEQIQKLMAKMETSLVRQDAMRSSTMTDVPTEYLSHIVKITELAHKAANHLKTVPQFKTASHIASLGRDIADVFDPTVMKRPEGRLLVFDGLKSFVEMEKNRVQDLSLELEKIV